MAQIKTSENGGDAMTKTGLVQVNSKNVKPTTTVAVPAPGTAITLQDVKQFDFFPVAQTSAGTDEITLASDLPVGTEIFLHAASACVVSTIASSGIGINGGTDAQGVAIAANGSMRLIKVSATRWIATAFTSAGVSSAPTPA